MKSTHALLSAAVLLLPASGLWSAANDTLTPQQSHEDYLRENYVKTEHMVPMRDDPDRLPICRESVPLGVGGDAVIVVACARSDRSK